MSLLELEDRQGYLVTQATDMRKRFNSLTLLLLASTASHEFCLLSFAVKAQISLTNFVFYLSL